MSSHLPVLLKLVLETKGRILELGSGVFSTPLLHWLCAKNKRELVTCENDAEFFQMAKQYQSRNHHIVFINNWDEIKLDKHWGVILIDNRPEFRRAVDAIKFKNNADFIILTDTEEKYEPVFEYKRAWPHFHYRYDDVQGNFRTTVVSNFRNLDKISF